MDVNDWRPRCESCRTPMFDVVFRIHWRDEVFFDVCEACVPVPDEDKYTVLAIRYDKEREMEQGD